MKQTPNYTKGVVLFTILVLPSLLYLYLTSGKHNFVYLPIIADQEQNYDLLLDEARRENPSHHYITDFALNDSLNLSDLDGSLKLIFCSRANQMDSSRVMAYMIQTEVWGHLKAYKDLFFINFVIEDSTHQFNQFSYEDLKLPKDQWINIPISEQELKDLMVGNIWVGKIKDAMLNNGIINTSEAVIVDRERRIRSGFDNQDRILYTYNNMSKFEIKLLMDDLKLLMAEYQRELKRRNE